MIKKSNSNVARKRRHVRVRKKITGNSACPRLNVYRSLNNIYAQIIDDDKGVTIAAASSLDESLKENYGGNKTAARAVGKLIAEKATKAGVKKVVFDRGGYLFHGRVKELADGAREGGLEF